MEGSGRHPKKERRKSIPDQIALAQAEQKSLKEGR